MEQHAFAAVERAIAEHRGAFAGVGGTLRPGYRLGAGWPTRELAIVVTVAADADRRAIAALPREAGGYPVDVRRASPLEALRARDPAAYGRSLSALRPEQRLATFPSECYASGETLAEAAAAGAVPAATKPALAYTPAPGASLAPVTDTFAFVAHASPDAGWPTLAPFLAGTQTQLTVAMYDFTSAHVLAAVEAALAAKSLELVLDHPPLDPTADQTDEQTHAALASSLGSGLTFAWALERDDPFADAAIFPTAYHIKVAVRDGAAFWISSGNWNDSNQPAIDPVADPTPAALATARTSDRDWHAIVTHAGLAGTFRAFVEHDLAVAAAHQATPAAAAAAAVSANADDAFAAELLAAAALAPRAQTPPFARFFAAQTFTDRMTITPLLTPDPGVYAGAILALIENATTSFHMQTQYVHPVTTAADAAFEALVAAIAALQQRGVDVKLIMSEFETAAYLEQLQAAGVDLAGVRIQNNVHNKGMVVDGAIAVVSSQNWSADGVLFNRDAGLIVEHAGVAAYYEALFEHDWTNLAKQATTA